MDITHDNVCSSMLSCFYLHHLSTGRPISSLTYIAFIISCQKFTEIAAHVKYSCNVTTFINVVIYFRVLQVHVYS